MHCGGGAADNAALLAHKRGLGREHSHSRAIKPPPACMDPTARLPACSPLSLLDISWMAYGFLDSQSFFCPSFIRLRVGWHRAKGGEPNRFFARCEEAKRLSVRDTESLPRSLRGTETVLIRDCHSPLLSGQRHLGIVLSGAVSVIYNANVNIHLAQSESGERRNDP
jgi:hypothetical protein